MEKELAEILADMKELESGRDFDRTHGEADFLLCKALKLLGQEKLVEAFDKVGKWYE